MQKRIIYIVIILIIIIATQPVLTSLLVLDENIIYMLTSLGYLLLIFPVYFLLQDFLKDSNKQFKKVLKEKKEIIKEYQSVLDAIKYDFIFYEHKRDEAFSYISPSVKDILGFDVEDFRKNHKRYNADILYNGAFDRIEKSVAEGLKSVPFEIEIEARDGNYISFEISEEPYFDEEGKLIKIKAVAHNASIHEQKNEVSFHEEEKYQTLFDNINDAVFVLDTDRLIECNNKTLNMFQVSLEQLIMYSPFSHKYSPKIQPDGKDSKEESLRRMKLAYEGEKQVFVWKYTLLNGDSFTANINLSLFHYRSKKYLLAVVKDITEQLKIEQQLKERLHYVSLIFDQSSYVMISFDAEGIITNINNVFYEMFKENESLLGKHINDLFENQEFQDAVELLNLEEKVSFRAILQSVRTQEKVSSLVKMTSLIEKDQVKGGIITIEKITDTAELKKILNKKEANFTEILNKSRDALYKYNIEEDKYEYLSKAIFHIFGYSIEEIAAMSAEESINIIHPDDRDKADKILSKLIKDNTENDKLHSIEYKIIRKDGEVRWVSDNYSAIYDNKKKKPISILGTLMDITEKVKIEEAIKEKEYLLRMMSENISQGITIITDNKIVLVNKRLEEITGYSPKELNHLESLFIFAIEREKERLKDVYNKIITGTGGIQELTFWISRKDDRNICINNKYHFDPQNPKNRFVITTDITQEKINQYKLTQSLELKKELESFLGPII